MNSKDADHRSAAGSTGKKYQNPNMIHMLRTMQQHHVQLSSMADHKAGIIIGAAFVVLALVFGKGAGGGEVPLSMMLLAITILISALLAALAVTPRFGKVPKTGRNMLFFGHFTSVSEDEFLDEIREILSSEENVYDAMARDTYQIGRVLHRRKYRYLAWSYRVLIAGGFVCAMVFIAETWGWL